MSSVPPVGGASGTQNTQDASNSASSSNTLDYDDFLQLMVAQMQNQDPLNPTDSTEYMSQIAQFSSVEQGINTNNKLDYLLFNSDVLQANTMVGQTITSADGSVTGTIASVRIDSAGPTAILDDGTEVPITTGVNIGKPVQSDS
jgi:flagellar basal-body rod modification protein FlgD